MNIISHYPLLYVLKIGDKVKIVENYKNISFDGIPADDVDKLYGEELTIKSFTTYGVFLEESQWFWNPNLLEKVEN